MLTERICQHCRWWHLPKPVGFRRAEYGVCQLLQYDCEQPPAAHPSYDDSVLHTKPDFGCNQWEVKP